MCVRATLLKFLPCIIVVLRLQQISSKQHSVLLHYFELVDFIVLSIVCLLRGGDLWRVLLCRVRARVLCVSMRLLLLCADGCALLASNPDSETTTAVSADAT